VIVDPRVEVVGARDDVESGLLGEHGVLEQDLGLVGLMTA
jgi:hypothetical protein